MKRQLLVSLLLMEICCGQGAAAAVPIENEVLSDIHNTRSEISQAEKQQREAMAQLFVINQRIKTISKKRHELSQTLLDRESQVRDLVQNLESLEDKATKQEVLLNRRLRRLYQGTEHRSFQWLFSSQTPVQLERNHRFLRKFVDADHQQLKNYLASVRTMRSKRDQLKKMVGALARTQKSVDRQEKELSEQMNEKSRIVAKLRQTKDQRLNQLLGLRQNASVSDYAFFEKRGQMNAPAQGELKRSFGTFVDHQYGIRLMHKGFFYALEPGSPIRAVFDGQVVLADELPGYGPSIIIDHGDNYYSVYAYAQKLNVRRGVSVKEGDLLAFSGSYSALFGPGLYFEIRHFTDAIDPKPWIKDSVLTTARGIDSTQELKK